jgi:hypothetical protein
MGARPMREGDEEKSMEDEKAVWVFVNRVWIAHIEKGV